MTSIMIMCISISVIIISMIISSVINRISIYCLMKLTKYIYTYIGCIKGNDLLNTHKRDLIHCRFDLLLLLLLLLLLADAMSNISSNNNSSDSSNSKNKSKVHLL